MTPKLGSKFSTSLGTLALVATVAISTNAHADDADNKHDEGVALVKQGQFEAARIKLLQALGVRPMAKTMLNLCVVEQQMKLEPEALKHCRQFIDAKDADPAMVQTVKDGILHELEQATGKVTIVTEAGQKVEIDGRPVGTAPIAQPIELRAGEHACSAGGKTIKVVVHGGETVTVKLVHEGPPPEMRKPGWLVPGIFAGVGVAGIGAGVVLGVVASGKASTLNGAQGEGRTCTGTADPACEDLNSALSGGKGMRTGSYIAYGVGGAALVGAVIAAVVVKPWQERRVDEASATGMKSATLVPIVEPGRGELVITGRF